MMLSRKAILMAIKQGRLGIDPIDEADIEAAHINLHLDDAIGEIVIEPKAFVVNRTREVVTLSQDFCGLMEGRSRLARLGISVEQSSTFVEPGTDNPMMLEIFNASDQVVTLRGGQEIAKLMIMKLTDTL
jgi:dCTP deaminase